MAKSMNTFYRHILAESWTLASKYLFLWPLALLTSFVGVFGTFQVLFDISETPSTFSFTNIYGETDLISSIFVGWSQSFEQIPWGRLVLADFPVLLFFFFLLFVVITIAILVTSSEGALIYALNQLQANKKTSYLVSFRQGLDAFWQLFGINFIYRLLYLIVMSLIVMPLLYLALVSGPGGNLLYALISYFIAVPVIVIFDLVVRYALMYIMLDGLSIKAAFKGAWLLFWTNWVISLETSLVIMATLFLAFLVMSLILLPLLAFFLTMFGAFIALSPATTQLFVFLIVILLLAIVALFISIFTTVQMSIWVGVFRKLTTGEHHSKIHRLTRHLPFLHRHII
jgi:hypothetical protein